MYGRYIDCLLELHNCILTPENARVSEGKIVTGKQRKNKFNKIEKKKKKKISPSRNGN